MRIPKDKIIYLGLGVILCFLAVFLIQGAGPSRFSIEAFHKRAEADTPMVIVGNAKISVEISETREQVEKGLSGRISLPQNSGMLFIFPQSDFYRFWMPNMYFPIDIIWINQGKIVDISANVSNDFDPMQPKFYVSSKPAQYVLEVNAGFAKRNNIQIGDTVTFQNIR